MPELRRLRLDHAPALLTFEKENRAYFSASIPDRGDGCFARFDERLAALLAEQAAGVCYFHVLVDDRGRVVGRVNLIDVADRSAELGYRIAECRPPDGAWPHARFIRSASWPRRSTA
ncbi:GNAT family N-acetyltransferase [Nonomuraea pusilla]|uniref:Ribosomal-protein-alanine N-acetyltransferase n=1 Tax=Nonomuraea pusilla TaxID=46177 RepID=A0A1H8C3Q3_9ACTN|nr:hypothetical protein [Nonomuraea pusilla]SEM88908.1 ribosomal-protein-alanine N-acetyltransferase [Nonomuraea pusilla]